MKDKRYYLAIVTLSFILGVFVTGTAVWLGMPKVMLVVHQSRYDSVEKTCEKLKASVEANGWSVPAIRNLNAAIAEQSVHMDRQVRIVELCNAVYARDIICTNPEVSTLMPCAWGVYKGDDGKVYISGMNMGLMGKMFGGNISKIMGEYVSRDEADMLRDVIQE